jgi:hypothetical protein
MRPRSVLIIAVLVAWGLLHHGAIEYVSRYPSALGPAVFPQLLKVLARLVVMAWLLAAAAGIGRPLIRRLNLSAGPGERFILEAGLGLGLISHILFCLGLLSLWRPVPLLVLAGLLSIPAWLALKSLRGRLSFVFQPTWTQALFLSPVILAALHGLVAANAPPTDWDSLAVHLEVPRKWVLCGGLASLRWLIHGLDPMAIEVLYVPALVFKAAELPAVIGLLFQSLMAAGLWVFGRKLASGPIALAAVALFLCQPAVSRVSGTPGTDFGVGLFAMLAFWSAWRGVESKAGRWLALSGAFAGLAAVSKTTGIFLAVSLALVIAVRLLGKERELRRWGLLWAGAALLFSAPWFLRSLIHTGNPVWPYLPGLFGGSERDLYIYERAKAAASEGLGAGWLQLLLLPLNLALKSESFRHSSQVLMIPFLFLGLADWRLSWKDAFTRWFLGYGAAFTGLWFCAVQNWRYFIPLMPWMCLLVCAWAAHYWAAGGWGRLLAAVLAAGFLGLPDLSANNALFPVLGLKSQRPGLSSRQAYLRRSLSSHAAVEHINRTLPADAHVLLYREVRSFYLERGCHVGDPQNEALIRYEGLKNADELYARLRELGIRAVLVEPRHEPFNASVPAFRRADALMTETLRRFAAAPLDIDGALLYAWKLP